MEVCRRSSWLLLLLGASLLATTLQGVQGEAESEGPSESECRPYIEKALKELETGDTAGTPIDPNSDDSEEDVPTIEITTDDSDHQTNDDDGDAETREESVEQTEQDVEEKTSNEQFNTREETDAESEDAKIIEDGTSQKEEETTSTKEESIENIDNQSEEVATKSDEQNSNENDIQPSEENLDKDEISQVDAEQSQEDDDDDKQSQGDVEKSQEENDAQESHETTEQQNDTQESQETPDETGNNSDESNTIEQTDSKEDSQNDDIVSQNLQQTKQLEESAEIVKQINEEESAEIIKQSEEENAKESSEQEQSVEEEKQSIEEDEEKTTEQIFVLEKSAEEDDNTQEETNENISNETSIEKEIVQVDEQTLDTTEDDTKSEEQIEESKEEEKSVETANSKSDETDDNKSESKENASNKTASEEQDENSTETKTSEEIDQRSTQQDSTLADEAKASESAEIETKDDQSQENRVSTEDDDDDDDDDNSAPEEELSLDFDIPTELRNTDHVEHLLKLDAEASETETIINRVAEITLRDLKKLYENAIKPLETLYKYRDLSNRHFGDSEIFSKPLILFMGPWSGGKSSIINYLLDNEYNETSLKTGAEPSPAYFNLLLHGDEYEVIDGTQLAADFTFSGLQKFGQGLEERLRGVKLPHKLLEKVNIVEIPGILEVRKQVSRVFPFNDACQWFIDRADIIFLVYDPSKLDVGPETEAILDQLKGREHQSRIILNKADQVKPEELMRVQGALIWNISPLMSSPQPPIMYTTSLWSRPYEPWAPTRLLQAQERAFLRDLRSAVDKRIENKIASARRFAVRVRNHAKMVDCYLTTYYNHKSVFGNRKQVADEIIDHPQDYHIYEGLSTLTNISRYDLPDPDVYRDFFKLNPLYEFQQLSATCTYFRGCPINRLDIAIAYDLPELIGKHKRLVESALAEAHKAPVPGS